MIDYFAHVAALRHLEAWFAGTAIPDAAMAARRDELLAAAGAERGAALFGTLLDHILVHAASDGTELDLLERAGALWRRGLAVYDQVTAARGAVEAALVNPAAPDALDRINQARTSLAEATAGRFALLDEVRTLRDDVAEMRHLPSHPRQSDLPADAWTIGDRFLGRRTDAFVRAVFDQAVDDMSRAFAFGALAAYAGNVAGSAYLGQTVGGPRRTHRFRERLARYAVGAWFAREEPLPTLADIADGLQFGAAGATIAVPAGLKPAVRQALAEAFGPTVQPDLDLGLRRTVRHLELLATFDLPPPPLPPRPELAPLMELLPPEGIAGGVHPLADDPLGTGEPQPGGGPQTPSHSESKESMGTVCALVILAALILVVLIIDCIVQLIDHGSCDPGDTLEEIFGPEESPPPVPSTSQQGLAAASGSPVGARLVDELHKAQAMLWQALASAHGFLAVCGLVHPNAFELGAPVHAQFTKAPAQAQWPRREEADPGATYHLRPSGPVEKPTGLAMPFALGAVPRAFLDGAGSEWGGTARSVAERLWYQIVQGARDSDNLDMDADRGAGHACWATAPGTSVHDDPLTVETVPYNAI
jgi:hypothetical protein